MSPPTPTPTPNVTDRLAGMRQQLTQASQSRARSEGELSAAMARLKKEFGVETLAAASNLRDRMGKDLSTAEARLQRDLAALEADFPWDPA